MTFTQNDKLKALGIVNIFETSRPFGEYAACAVLDDGAGISYGISQFTHRSGSLASVVETYLANGGRIAAAKLKAALPDLHDLSPASIKRLAADAGLKRALRSAAITSEMKDAQREAAFEKYLLPALQICEARRFVEPLSLAVIYDSLNHGSLEYISARVTPIGVVRQATADDAAAEKKWITEYVRTRDRWLTEVRRLKATRYRTKFFLDQIATGNWEMKLPMTVHGVRFTEDMLCPEAATAVRSGAASEPGAIKGDAVSAGRGDAGKSVFETTEQVIASAAEKFDRLDNAVTTATTRTDRAKSLWTTIVGTVGQAAWAVFGFAAGLPREVWIVVAVLTCFLMLAYLYRQIELGRIRERRN